MTGFFENLFGKRPPSRSQVWAQTLPPSPLNQHLASLHALLLHLGAEGQALEMGEHHLHEIATFTRIDPNMYPR